MDIKRKYKIIRFLGKLLRIFAWLILLATIIGVGYLVASYFMGNFPSFFGDNAVPFFLAGGLIFGLIAFFELIVLASVLILLTDVEYSSRVTRKVAFRLLRSAREAKEADASSAAALAKLEDQLAALEAGGIAVAEKKSNTDPLPPPPPAFLKGASDADDVIDETLELEGKLPSAESTPAEDIETIVESSEDIELGLEEARETVVDEIEGGESAIEGVVDDAEDTLGDIDDKVKNELEEVDLGIDDLQDDIENELESAKGVTDDLADEVKTQVEDMDDVAEDIKVDLDDVDEDLGEFLDDLKTDDDIEPLADEVESAGHEVESFVGEIDQEFDASVADVKTVVEDDATEVVESAQDTVLRSRPTVVAGRENTIITAAASPEDDLTKIEGIGPKIASLLQASGIANFERLANVQPSSLQKILRGAGLRFANPATWPEQAQYATKNDWDGLTAFQKTLKGGKRR